MGNRGGFFSHPRKQLRLQYSFLTISLVFVFTVLTLGTVKTSWEQLTDIYTHVQKITLGDLGLVKDLTFW